MKKTKQFLSVIIITLMMFTLGSFTVSADDTFTITVKNTNSAVSIDGVEYTAYKVFDVKYDQERTAYTYDVGDDCLSKNYGTYNTSNITESNVQVFGTYVYNNFIKGKTDTIAATVAKASATASGQTATITTPSAGYYVVVGTAKNLSGDPNNNQDVVTSLVMLNTADPNVEVNTKLDAPSLDKQIQHNENENNNDKGWGVVGDNQIGDTVNFRIITKVPDLNGYTDEENEKYTYTIHDTMTAGLGFNQNSVSVKVNDGIVLEQAYYNVTATPGGQTLTVDFDINKAVAENKVSTGDMLYTYYSATLNTSALIASSAPDGTNHNDNTAYLEYSNNPYDNSSKGKTPDKKVYDWTYAFTVNKVKNDAAHTPLAGAGFTIKEGEAVIKFTKKDGVEEYVVDPNGTTTEIKTTSTGTFKILGLDDQTTYTLTESTVPNGYKKCEDVTFNLTSDYNTDGNSLTSLSSKIGNEEPSNQLSVTVENVPGAKLVGTGGIGTTIFYIIGGVLMGGAIILLIVKKIVKNKNA